MIWTGISKLGSLKLTPVILALVGIGAAISYRNEGTTTWAMALPLFLVALNILAAVLTNKKFHRNKPLLIFHLALIAVVVLVALGRLTYLRGHVELTEGEEFSSQLAEVEKGPWHWGNLNLVSFANEGFTVQYSSGVKVKKIENSIRWRDEEGKEQQGVIGGLVPLKLHGYKFYPSANKGFAPTFIWRPKKGGSPMLGSVHLPSYPMHEYRQALAWTPPASETNLWIMLQFDEVILDPAQPSLFRAPRNYQLIVRSGEQRWQLKPGESVTLPDGVLEFEGLRNWMGYSMVYDFTLPWILAAAMLAVGSMAAYFWSKFTSRPWDK
ncbi:MAG: cytochrome c biogenesis protein ResB [Pseudomonadota bacterium]